MLAIVIVIIVRIITDEEWISINSLPIQLAIQLAIQLIRDPIWCQVSTLYPKYTLYYVYMYNFILFIQQVLTDWRSNHRLYFFPLKKNLFHLIKKYMTQKGFQNPFADPNFQILADPPSVGGYDIFIFTSRWQKGEKYSRMGSFHCGLFKGLFVWYLAHSDEGLGVRVAMRTTFRYLKVSTFMRIY